MTPNEKIDLFLSQYDGHIFANAMELRVILFANLPGIIEQIDIPAKMIAYCYGQKYSEMICTVRPSKKGLKLGFYKGADLPDPGDLLEGTGKISRYVNIKSIELIRSSSLKNLLKTALTAYRQRISG